MSLKDIIENIVQSVIDRVQPARIVYGTVIAVSPVEVRINERLIISGDALIIPRELQAGAVFHTHTHKVQEHDTEEYKQEFVTQASGKVVIDHIHHVLEQETTPEETRIGLRVGETVILLRNQGGQEYLVLGRL